MKLCMSIKVYVCCEANIGNRSLAGVRIILSECKYISFCFDIDLSQNSSYRSIGALVSMAIFYDTKCDQNTEIELSTVLCEKNGVDQL